MGRARSRTINKNSKKPLKIGLIVGFVSLIIIFLFAFIIPIKSDANSYNGGESIDDGQDLCFGVDYEGLFGPIVYLYPKNTKFYVHKGDSDNYNRAVAKVQEFAKRIPPGQIYCGYSPNYKLFL